MDSTPSTGNEQEQWTEDYFEEYVRGIQFNKLMGASPNDPIQLNEDLKKEVGDKVSFQLVERLSADGVTGDNTLEGNEEELETFAHKVEIDQRRNAVRVGRMAQRKTNIDYMEAAKPALMNWEQDKLRDDIIRALMSPNIDGKTSYADSTEAQKDAWLAANADRIQFGASISNNSANDHSASLLNVDSSSDKLTTGLLSLVKRRAKLASRAIRPYRVEGEQEEWFVFLAHPYQFRDLRADTTMQGALQYAWERNKDNPLFASGDLIWDGIFIKEIEEMDVIAGAGNGAIDVAPGFLLGAQAIGVAWGQRPKFVVQDRDYKNKVGIAITEVLGVEKLSFNSVQNGLLTVYTAAVADS